VDPEKVWIILLGLLWCINLLLISVLMFIIGLFFFIIKNVFLLSWEIYLIKRVEMEIILIFDWLSFFFLRVVLLISSMVLFYRNSYIGGDKNLNRFIYIVLLFVFSIASLILSPNLIRIMLGWDGLGLVSYCLVIYYQNLKSYNAGILTVLSNRLGDVALLLGIGILFDRGTWRFIFLNLKEGLEFLILFAILAAITKRAQIPFSAWLPAAMAAPTPVSALVHSSTLVTAGVYLIIRFSSILSDHISFFLFYISVLTILISGLGANFEFDLKKIIALSTLRQLGLIISILSLGIYKIAFFHLLTHAIFKALLFLCGGYIIHQFNNIQDIRLIRGVGLVSPITISIINISNLALCGFPFLAGFYSKDIILESIIINGLNLIGIFLLIIACGFTVMYTVRLIIFIGIEDRKSFRILGWMEVDFYIKYSIVVLGLIGIIMGSSLNWLFFGGGLVFVLGSAEKIIVFVLMLIGLLFSLGVNEFNLYRKFFGDIWFLPKISRQGLILSPLFLRQKYYYVSEMGWNEIFGGKGTQLINLFLSVEGIKYYRFNIKLYLVGYITIIYLVIIILCFFSL